MSWRNGSPSDAILPLRYRLSNGRKWKVENEG
jgi:hypothetical protein